MAGPTAGILLREKISGDQHREILERIAELSSSQEGVDAFRLEERPFLLQFGPDYPECFEEMEQNGVPGLLGWTPRDELVFSAMCNDPSDHLLPGRLCLRFAQQLNGVIDFGGGLGVSPEGPHHGTLYHVHF